jgi:segregation and condensation protein B
MTLDLILENLFLAASGPLTRAQMGEILDLQVPEELAELDSALARLQERAAARGVQLVEIAGGYALATRPEHARWVTRLQRTAPAPLSEEAKITLAIVAYLQPITRAEIEKIRGTDSESVLATLLRTGLVTVMGELDRAYLYGTSSRFLERFGLKHLADLPQFGALPSDRGATPVSPATPDATVAVAVPAPRREVAPGTRPDGPPVPGMA